MARIRTYELDTNLTANDYLLGNDGDGGAVITKRFSLPQLRDYFIQGTDVDILATTPKRYIPTVNQEGTDIERSPFEVIHTSVTSISLVEDNMAGGQNVRYIINQDGRATLEFENFFAPYDLPSLVNKLITFRVAGNRSQDYTARVVSYKGFHNDASDSNLILDRFTIETTGLAFPTDYMGDHDDVTQLTGFTVDPSISPADTPVQEVSVRFLGDLTLLGNFTVNGMSQFNGDITIGDASPTNNPVDVNLYGDINIPTPEGGIVFGDATDNQNVRLTTDSDTDNLVINGGSSGGRIINNVETTFTRDIDLTNDGMDPVNYADFRLNGGDIEFHQARDNDGNGITDAEGDAVIGTIRTFTYDNTGMRTEGPVVAPVVVNGTEGTDRGLFTGIQVGTGTSAENWHALQAASSVAQVIPGVFEELNSIPQDPRDLPSASTDTTGVFFYGIDRGTFAQYGSAVSQTISAITLTAGQTRVSINNVTQDTALRAAFQATPSGRRLMFTTGTDAVRSAALPNRLTFTARQPFGRRYRVTDDSSPALVETVTVQEAGATTLELAVVMNANGGIEVSEPGSSTFSAVSSGVTFESAEAAAPTDVSGTRLEGPIYEVTTYEPATVTPGTTPTIETGDEGTFEYTEVGSQGHLQIATPEFSIEGDQVNIPNLPRASSSDTNLLFRNPTTGRVSANTLAGAFGANSEIQWRDEGEDINAGSNVRELIFSGNHNISGAGANVSIDLTGRFGSGGVLPGTTAASNLQTFHWYILNTIANDSIVNLPEGNPGDMFRFINLSTLDDDGRTRTPGPLNNGIWTIRAASGERIMRDLNDRDLTMDDRTANFDIMYTDAANGWIIIH